MNCSNTKFSLRTTVSGNTAHCLAKFLSMSSKALNHSSLVRTIYTPTLRNPTEGFNTKGSGNSLGLMLRKAFISTSL